MADVIGAGLAGAAAALELLRLGHRVTIHEKSRFPRHKVCGEFLDAAAVDMLTGIPLHGAAITEAALIWRKAEKRFRLPRPALGISRKRLDHLHLNAAIEAGATLVEQATTPHDNAIVAFGRKLAAERGHRLFGYKAHFTGPQNSAVELYFEGQGYTGINPVEDGCTNVCGIAPESALKACNFDIDAFLAAQPHVNARIAHVTRAMDWMFTGPLCYGLVDSPEGYACGDALGFIDPFTGSGMLRAISTGRMAARALHEGASRQQHHARCREYLHASSRWSGLLRQSLSWPATPYIARFVPGAILYEFSRPAAH